MNIRELIEKLERIDPEASVWFDYGGTIMKAEEVYEEKDRIIIG